MNSTVKSGLTSRRLAYSGVSNEPRTPLSILSASQFRVVARIHYVRQPTYKTASHSRLAKLHKLANEGD